MKRSCCLLAGLMLLGAFGAQSLSARSDTPASAAVSPFASLASGPAKTRIARDLGRLPLSFERNKGQTDSHVRFLAHCTDGALFLTPSEAVFNLTPRTDTGYSAKNALCKGRSGRSEGKAASVTVRMQIVGSDPRASVLQQQPLPGRVNYFSGKDPSKWHAGVPTFGRVGFHGVYPGVDLVYYGNQRHLEYDFVVAPHADPKQIKLHFAGAQHVQVNAAGELVVRAEGRELKW
ncbi:MAG: Cell surface protein, partial [Chthonomonadaceae bacterium]|nr:Cell surface protein [Chthonomonadaceae bacterium]